MEDRVRGLAVHGLQHQHRGITIARTVVAFHQLDHGNGTVRSHASGRGDIVQFMSVARVERHRWGTIETDRRVVEQGLHAQGVARGVRQRQGHEGSAPVVGGVKLFEHVIACRTTDRHVRAHRSAEDGERPAITTRGGADDGGPGDVQGGQCRLDLIGLPLIQLDREGNACRMAAGRVHAGGDLHFRIVGGGNDEQLALVEVIEPGKPEVAFGHVLRAQGFER